MPTVPRALPDGTHFRIDCQESVTAYNENMGGVDLVDMMHRFYTCTHKSSRRWYLWLFWLLLDVGVDNVDNVFILECYTHPAGGRHKSKEFRKELATHLLSLYSSQQRSDHQAHNAPAGLVQRNFPKYLGDNGQCVVCRKEHTHKSTRYGYDDCGNVYLCIDLCFRIHHTSTFIWEGVCYPCVSLFTGTDNLYLHTELCQLKYTVSTEGLEIEDSPVTQGLLYYQLAIYHELAIAIYNYVTQLQPNLFCACIS